jgi:hypothetical protein
MPRANEDLSQIGYGNRRDYRKIDLYTMSPSTGEWQYVASTTWSRTCREAAAHFKRLHPEQTVKAHFARSR